MCIRDSDSATLQAAAALYGACAALCKITCARLAGDARVAVASWSCAAAMLQMRSAKFDFFSGGEEFALALNQVRLLRSKILRQLACVRGVVHACHHSALPASTSLLIIAAAAFKLRGHPQREHAEQPEVATAGQSLHV